MPILHATSEPQFTGQRRLVPGNAYAQPHSVDIAVGYLCLSDFNAVADLLASRPGQTRVLIGRANCPTMRKSPPDTTSTERALVAGGKIEMRACLKTGCTPKPASATPG